MQLREGAATGPGLTDAASVVVVRAVAGAEVAASQPVPHPPSHRGPQANQNHDAAKAAVVARVRLGNAAKVGADLSQSYYIPTAEKSSQDVANGSEIGRVKMAIPNARNMLHARLSAFQPHKATFSMSYHIDDQPVFHARPRGSSKPFTFFLLPTVDWNLPTHL